MRRFGVLAALGTSVAAVGTMIWVAIGFAGWHILSETAINTQKLCRDGLTYTWASGQQPGRPPAIRPAGTPRFVGPVDLLVQFGDSSLPSDSASWEGQPMAGADVFTADYAPVNNPQTTPASWYPWSHSGVVPFRFPLTPGTQSVRIDTEPNGNNASEVFLPVGNCYRFGPIDIAPGDPSNTVHLGGTVVVALLATPTFRASNVAVGSVLFGATGTEAIPTASSKVDVNGDGRVDLRLTFALDQTGITCSQTSAELSATAPKLQKRFYEGGTVTPTPCP